MGKSLVSCFLTQGVFGAGSMHLSGVRPSVCLSQRGQQQQTAGDIDRLLHSAQQRGVRRANAGCQRTY